jgi:lysophospholipase L1-like esterase
VSHRIGALACATIPLLAALTAQPAQALTPNTLLDLGDSWSQGVGDRNPDNGLGWAPVTASLLSARLTQDGKGGSGYVNPTAYGAGTFDQRVYRHPANAYRWVVIQGSTNDRNYLSSLAGSANMTLRAAKARYPSARIVVVGPTAVNGAPDATTLTINAKLKSAASAAGVVYIDAIAEQWFRPGDWGRYSDAATGHPNDAAYTVIGKHVAADIASLS